MSPMGQAAEQVEHRLAEGWRPSQTRERTWVRGGASRRVGEDLVEDLTGAKTAPMTAAEELELIGRRWAPESDGG